MNFSNTDTYEHPRGRHSTSSSTSRIAATSAGFSDIVTSSASPSTSSRHTAVPSSESGGCGAGRAVGLIVRVSASILSLSAKILSPDSLGGVSEPSTE